MDKIEAIVDAIGNLNGTTNPEADAYKLRNPLLIKSFARPGKHIIDEKGRRVFESYLAGYKAATFDVQLKVSGKSRAGLKPTDTITALLGVYGLKEKLAIDRVVNFLKKALQDKQITANTPLSYFMPEEKTDKPKESND